MRQFTETFYQNEHLLYGHLGHFLIITAFITALFTFISGMRAFLKPNRSLEDVKLVKNFFWTHAWSVFLIMGLIIFLFKSQLFEYHYIWRHSSRELPWYYIFSAIWEGQEGSFLLWIFWQAVLGLFLMRNMSENKLGALAILGLVQMFLMTMILGVDIFDKLIGTNPFILLRDELNIPILQNPNYLELIKDGNGLNILLQNYWMVIHPPVLFLGFASTVVPFGFAVSGLIKRDFESWTKEVTPWALFSLAILGTGILMGGRWAYEALSFGGFWAWDPVENASLVPWLFLVAGIHTLMIFRATGHSLKASFILFILSFTFVLYSTFLTRSGILGNSSVHSFTDLGMQGQLLIFLATLVIPPFLLLAYYWSKIPQNNTEEKTWSREFWMFLGALFIVVSALQITFTTSIPVWNKIYDLKLAPPLNANAHYNGIQIWFAIVVCFLMGASIWFLYKDTKEKKIFQIIGLSAFIGLVIAVFTVLVREIEPFQQYSFEVSDYKVKFKFISSFLLLFWSTAFLILTSIYFILSKLKNQSKWAWGGSIAHIGFWVMILGALISQYEKKPISVNKARIDFGKEMAMEEQSSNSLLMNGDREEMGDYLVSYQGKSKVRQGEKYSVLFVNKKNSSDSFRLYPEAKIIKEGDNNRLNPEPSIRHLLGKDIFAHVSSVPEDNAQPKPELKSMKMKDSLYTRSSRLVFDTMLLVSDGKNGNLEVNVKLINKKLNTKDEILLLPYKLDFKTNTLHNPILKTLDGSIGISLAAINPDKNTFEFSILDTNKPQDWIIIKVLEFPHISILWIGSILMTIGALMSAWHRRKRYVNGVK